MPTKTYYLELEVSLAQIDPPPWRRFLLRKNCCLHELHDTIQRACGWLDYHLYAFREPTGERNPHAEPAIALSPFDEPLDPEENAPNACSVPMREWLQPRWRTRLLYIYDFGDDWLHHVTCLGERQLTGTTRRYTLDGARAFPPEDCGGPPGYEECVRAASLSDAQIARIEDPFEREELATRKEWLGDWDPEHFDLEATKAEMSRRVNWP